MTLARLPMTMNIPAVPAEFGETRTSDIGRLLMGGDRGNAVFQLFADRCHFFKLQPLEIDSDRFSGLFYERLRNLDEVWHSLAVSYALLNRGVPLEEGIDTRLAIEIFPSFFDAPDGDVPMPGEDEPSRGEHAISLVAFPEGDIRKFSNEDWDSARFLFGHLFSPDWRAGTIPLPYLEKCTHEARAARGRPGPKPTNGESDRDALTRSLIKGYADLKPGGWASSHTDDDVIWAGRWLIGAGSGDPWLQSALLVRGITEQPLQVAWMFAGYINEDLVDVEEFFVWPTYRKNGYGAALAGRTLIALNRAQCTAVRWLEQESDAFVNRRTGTDLPNWARNFVWTAADPDELGWRVNRVTEPVPIVDLLRELGALHAPGGAHLAWRDGLLMVVDHDPPQTGVVVGTDIWFEGHEEVTQRLGALDAQSGGRSEPQFFRHRSNLRPE